MLSRSACRMALILACVSFGLGPLPINCQAGQTPASDMSIKAVAPEKDARLVSLSRSGLLIANREHSFEMKVHGYIQGDARFFASDRQDRQRDQLLFRRVRPLVEGTLAHAVDFRFMPDFGEGNAEIQEVYVEWKSIPFANLRVGKFKTPIGLEALRSDRDLTFAERSLASDLVPLRDLGAQVGSSFLNGTIEYEVGYFSGTEDGANAKFGWQGTKEGVARAFFKPFAATNNAAAQQFGIGISASDGHHYGALPRMKTMAQQTFFKYSASAMADGEHKRLAPQAYYFYGPAGLMAEYIVSGGTVRADAGHCYLSNTGWGVAGSFVITGEKNTYDGIQPAHDAGSSRGFKHLGIWEVALRYSGLDVDPRAFPKYAEPASSAKGARESAVGLNWYVNSHTKLMVDYEYTSFRTAAESVRRPSPERVAMTRLQLAF